MELRRNFLTDTAISQWNSLPAGVVGAPSLVVFKKDWTAISLAWCKDSCLRQGIGLVHFQGPFQTYDSMGNVVSSTDLISFLPLHLSMDLGRQGYLRQQYPGSA